MWTERSSKRPHPLQSTANDLPRSNPRPIGGFTLIELLITVSIISLLATFGVASLSGARQSAQSVIALANVRQLSTAQAVYAFQHDSWLAGPNTSGAGAIIDRDSIVGNTTPSTPTTTHDWISPILGDELSLSPNRAERTAQIFHRFACPRATSRVQALFGYAHDADDFEAIAETRGFVQVSYLSPASFHYRPDGGVWTPRILARPGVGPLTAFDRPYNAPANYRPRLDAIDRPYAKAIVADGTRYVALGREGLRLDFDVTPDPRIYGSFTSAGPIFHSSRAYGRGYARLIGGSRFNVDLSMRYFRREMHVAYFDTHAGRLAAERVWSDPDPWYPRGSRYEGGDVTPELAVLYGANPARYSRLD